jgi:hypothetical protein
MGVAQELLGLAAFPWWSKQWTPLIVDALQQDGQEQAVVYVADVEQRRGSDAVSVVGRELKARHILIATGVRPVPLWFPGAEHIVTSDRFLELESLPRRISQAACSWGCEIRVPDWRR